MAVFPTNAYAGFKELNEKRADGTQQFHEAARLGPICGAFACSLGRIAFAGSLHDVWTAEKSQSPIQNGPNDFRLLRGGG